MADQKISQLPTITGANMADDDKFVLVDTSGDATVATTRAEFFKNTPNIDVTGNVGIGTDSPSTDSILDVQSTTKGVRFPNMTTTQKDAMGGVAGNMVFDTTLGKMCFNTGSGWETITSS
tara:strand:+ start:397 stop:756 length:360 start_codon:yes stop_codon:yes gene_type:complete